MSNQFLSFASIPQLSRFTGSLFLKEFSKLNQTCAQHSHTKQANTNRRNWTGDRGTNLTLPGTSLGDTSWCESVAIVAIFVYGTATSEQQQLLRLLLPLLKLYTEKQCMKVVSEGLESFGGQGYMEDTGIPVILRDAQVTPIWEGTTNILSLNVVRALAKSEGKVLIAFHQRIQSVLDSSTNPSLAECCTLLEKYRSQSIRFAQKNADQLEYVARDFAFGLARIL